MHLLTYELIKERTTTLEDWKAQELKMVCLAQTLDLFKVKKDSKINQREQASAKRKQGYQKLCKVREENTEYQEV